MACAPVEQAVTTAWLGPLQAVPDRDVAGGQVDQAPGNEERADAARPLLLQQQRRSRRCRSSPPMPEPISTPVRSCFSCVSAFQPASFDRLLGGGHGVDDEIVDLALLLRLHPVVGIELALGLAGRAARSSRSGRRGRRPRTPRSGARRSGRRSGATSSPRRRTRAA